jgi:glutaredoxin-like protein NrdH
MKVMKVPGSNNKHRVLLYALSTCAWCKRAKKLLKDENIEYEYIDVDLCDEMDRNKIQNDIKRRGGRPVYPTIIIDDDILITGFDENRIKEALRI